MRTGQVMSDTIGEKHSYIDLIGPVLPGLINDVIHSVVKPHLPSDESLDINMVTMNNTNVYDIQKCECRADNPLKNLHSSNFGNRSFIYRNQKFYCDTNML